MAITPAMSVMIIILHTLVSSLFHAMSSSSGPDNVAVMPRQLLRTLLTTAQIPHMEPASPGSTTGAIVSVHPVTSALEIRVLAQFVPVDHHVRVLILDWTGQSITADP